MLDLTITFLGLLLTIGVDSIYLTLNKDFYTPILEPGQNLNLVYGILAWLTIVISIQLIVLSRPDINASNVFINGLILGGAMYGLYNFTNASTYPNKWTNTIIIGDTTWGMLLTGSMSWILFNLQESIK
jgi:uncharacterized membrane protein